MGAVVFTASLVACAQAVQSETASSASATTAKAASAPAASAEKMMDKQKTEKREGPLAIGASMVMVDAMMKNVDDQMVSLAKAKGAKGTLVIFSCNHCPYVKAWEARIAKSGNAAQKMGFGVVAINANDPQPYPEDGFDEMKARAKKLGFEFPYVVDETSNVARAFGATKTPEVFLFDADDKLVYYGAVDDNYRDAEQVERHYLDEALKAVAGGQPVPKAVTKALGCSIKYRS
ncbi:MAG: thioredoxin family protein [Myxococcota bacterium]